MAELSKFQKFEIKRIARADIKGAKYNPRTISNFARKHLQANLKSVGLLGPVIMNSKTMTLVGGHQRLAALDALEGSPDYLLDVSMVKLTPKVERSQNVFMNNPAVQGEWDLPLLADLMPDLDLEATGFSEMEMEILLGTKGQGVFAAQSPEADAAFDDLEAMREAGDTAKKSGKAKPDLDEVAEKNAAVERRQKMREKGKQDHESGDTERVAYVVFKSRKDREDWMERHGEDRNARYIAAAKVR